MESAFPLYSVEGLPPCAIRQAHAANPFWRSVSVCAFVVIIAIVTINNRKILFIILTMLL